MTSALEILYETCRSQPGATEGFPFGDDVLVFKVGGKIFALINLMRVPLSINLKCDPPYALELRATYGGVREGYHMNKKHWNTIVMGEDVPVALVKELVEHSYQLVRNSLRRVDREALPPSDSPVH